MDVSAMTKYAAAPCKSLTCARRLTSQQNAQRVAKKKRQSALALAVVACCSTLISGCTRSHYRTRADIETGTLIAQKVDTAALPTIRNIQVDRSSRMFDPFNPDRPPMPEDDPTSHRYMQIVDGKKHYPLWYVNGRTNLAESPDWWQFLPLDERGVLVLDMNTSVKLALLHSPEYQQALETLFLSAIDVTSERFLFDNQFFGGYSVDYQSSGPGRRSNNGQSNTALTAGLFSRGQRPIALQRSFTTGATFVAGIANSLTWQLAGPDTQSANTVIDFSFFQPLLRGAGRDRVLETLTLAERTLLANVRQYERYRTGFALTIAVGRADETTPSRRGGLFGGAGLQGFTGLGGGFGAVGTNLGGGGAGGFGAGAAVPQAGGFLGLLQDQLTIRNTIDNANRLRQVLLQFEDQLKEQLLKIPTTQQEIPQQELQVVQTRQQLIAAQTAILNQQAQYEQSLDTFKADLGLPPYLCVEIKDPMLDVFNVVSPEMLKRSTDVALLRVSVGENNSRLLELSNVVNDEALGSYRTLENSEPVRDELTKLYNNDKKIKSLLDSIFEQDLPQIKGDIEYLSSIIPTRKKQLARLRTILDRERDAICSILPAKALETALFQDAELDQLPTGLTADVDRIEAGIRKYAAEYDKLLTDIETIASNTDQNADSKALFESVRDKAILQSQELLALISDDILALQVVQARARTESLSLAEVDIEQREAFDIARANRLDWMNNRAALVDRWRAIEVVADQLEGFLDVTFSGDIQNSNDNPFSLRNNTGRLRAGLQWDTPLTRLLERNQYRQILIEYQQAKRSFYQYEDNVTRTLRSELRQIRLNQFNFELQRYAVRIAASQVTLNSDIRSINEALQQGLGPTAARDTIQALDSLLTAQNTLLGVFVNYELQRRNLNQDLGTARVDGEGIWIDPGAITSETISYGDMMEANMEAATPFDLNQGAPGTMPEGVEAEALPNVSVSPIEGTPPVPEANAPGPVVPNAVLPVQPPVVQ
jgi:hypothetical protein